MLACLHVCAHACMCASTIIKLQRPFVCVTEFGTHVRVVLGIIGT